MMENFGTQVIYVRGNHDDFLDNLAPLNFYNAQVFKTCIYESHGRRYFDSMLMTDRELKEKETGQIAIAS